MTLTKANIQKLIKEELLLELELRDTQVQRQEELIQSHEEKIKSHEKKIRELELRVEELNANKKFVRLLSII